MQPLTMRSKKDLFYLMYILWFDTLNRFKVEHASQLFDDINELSTKAFPLCALTYTV